MQVLAGEVVRLKVQLDNGTVVNIVTSGEQLVQYFGKPTKCNRCSHPGSALVAGRTCNVCQGKMIPQ